MGYVLSLPILGLLVILQVAVFSNLQVLNGTADIVLLTIIAWSLQEKVRNGWLWALIGGGLISLISAVPLAPHLIGYLLIAVLCHIIKRRIWQIPALAMFFVTSVGTVFVKLLVLGILIFMGTRLEWIESINLVILPSVLLNLVLALPVFLLMSDLAGWVYPAEAEA
jgi:rod shape-determining protein MreD